MGNVIFDSLEYSRDGFSVTLYATSIKTVRTILGQFVGLVALSENDNALENMIASFLDGVVMTDRNLPVSTALKIAQVIRSDIMLKVMWLLDGDATCTIDHENYTIRVRRGVLSTQGYRDFIDIEV